MTKQEVISALQRAWKKTGFVYCSATLKEVTVGCMADEVMVLRRREILAGMLQTDSDPIKNELSRLEGVIFELREEVKELHKNNAELRIWRASQVDAHSGGKIEPMKPEESSDCAGVFLDKINERIASGNARR